MNEFILKNISKKFDGIQAVNNFSFEWKEHNIVGFIGPNGAGKLSGGEQQMLALGMALIQRPKLLLMDETQCRNSGCSILIAGFPHPTQHRVSSIQHRFKFRLESIHYINLQFLIAVQCAGFEQLMISDDTFG